MDTTSGAGAAYSSAADALTHVFVVELVLLGL
jgi:hypothetical protein